jgi:tetratricopeptide (TPR) repeat protein
MIQLLESEGLSAEYPVAYAVGAGKVGYSYLISIPPYLFQSPVSYYSQTEAWDVTPGYEPERVLDFTHPITTGCVFCHAGRMNLYSGSDDRFADPALTPISCERCHGAPEAHLKNPVRGSILNPAKLRPTARDSVCEQCHLEGEVRILNPGQHWQDFEAGEELESVFATYIRKTDPREGVKAVSQVEQLALSRCARESGGRLWCGTCHSPHSTATSRPKEVREACLSCHTALFTTQRHQPADECVSCHMPRLRPNDIAHAAITDHTIAIPRRKEPTRETGAFDLSPWREPPAAVAPRDLGLALFQFGSSTKTWKDVVRSYEILSHLPRRDSVVLATLGAILLEQNHAALAVALYKEAVTLEPRNARYAYLLGTALAADAKTEPAAIAELRKSIELDPSAPDPYRELARIYERTGQKGLSKQVLGDYLKFMPQNLSFRREK